MNATIVTIGDEILIGQIVDTNSAWIGIALNEIGISVREILSVSDTKDSIISGLKRAEQMSDVILMTGGLGPTADDITKPTLAEFFDCEMVFDQEMYDRIQEYFTKRDRPMTELHKNQCYLPAKAKVLKNDLGTAPGMWFEQSGKIFVSMPGVPHEMKFIMSDGVLPTLKKRNEKDHAIYHKTILTIGVGESMISEEIQDIIDQFPDYIKIAYLPGKAQVRLRLSGKHKDKKSLVENIEYFAEQITKRVGKIVYGYGKVKIQERIGQILIEKGLKLGTAESCTGGQIAASLVQIPGSSAYFEGSIVAYSYDLKEKLLDVGQHILNTKGAVSKEVVEQMVKGCNERLKTDIAIAVSGIAGPGGGTDEKPVGTVWIACGSKNRIVSKRYQLTKNRQMNIEYTVVLALNMIRLFLMGEDLA